MKKEINDTLDVISIAIATIISILLTTFIQHRLDQKLIFQRGRQATGGELFLYLLILGLSTYILYNIFTITLHSIRKNTDYYKNKVAVIKVTGLFGTDSYSGKYGYIRVSGSNKFMLVTDPKRATRYTKEDAEAFIRDAYFYCDMLGAENIIAEQAPALK